MLGVQFVATDAGQHGTMAISGSVVAAAGTDGDAVVIAISRPGSFVGRRSSPPTGQLLRAILAHL